MKYLTLGWSQVMLATCNFLLLICGFTLIAGGMMVLHDTERILLSKLLSQDGFFSTLPQPFFYYAALGLATLGITLATTGVLGCWASCMKSYILLSVYFLAITAVLIGECVIYAVAWIWPNCLGLISDPTELIRTLQKNYGVSGHEQLTIAIDLAQTTFECCGIFSANEYDTSLWRLQGLGPGLAVPLSCCKLTNESIPKSYLDPHPINTTLCQALEFNRHSGYRHLTGCNEALQTWYGQHFLIFLGIGLVAILVEFLVLLSTILSCTHIYRYKNNTKNQRLQQPRHKNYRTNSESSTSIDSTVCSNEYQRRPISAYTNDSYDMNMDCYRHNYKLSDIK